jgi:uracil-DNA glycosylase
VKNFNFPEPWKIALGASFCDDFFSDLTPRIDELVDNDVIFYPPIDLLFQALHFTSFLDTKVLILGQDPYHRFGQANGLAFSVDRDIPIPPSLKNIYSELAEDVECSNPSHGDLSFWSKQGVLLLNSSLSVEEGKPNSHQNLGWSILTNKIISKLSNRGGVIFVLWGNFAQKKMNLIDGLRNNILLAAHPSPFSSYRGFFGSKPFSEINKILLSSNKEQIHWQID